MNTYQPLNSHFDVDTPTPEKSWLELKDSHRISLINDVIARLNNSNKITCTRALSSGEVYLKILESIPVSERLDYFLDLELELKKLIDDAIFVSCEPLGDKSSLRNLRGIQVKTLKDN
jgi:hypothetical protein